MVTLTCELDPNQSPPIHVSFESDKNSLCYLEPSYGNCKNTSNSCITRYTASCHNETTYILQLTVPWNWNGMRVHCQTLYDRSNYVVFAVKGDSNGMFGAMWAKIVSTSDLRDTNPDINHCDCWAKDRYKLYNVILYSTS
uniref:Uncharacterized protein n=1 Tax=Magallana gigas TaxID=29159 RepID=K1PV43_MAGGI